MAELSDPRAQRSRLALLDAAAELLDHPPVSVPSVTDVAALAGVSRPTFYQHFADVPALMATAVTDELAQAFVRSDTTLTDASGVAFLRGTNRMLVAHIMQRREVYREILHGPASYAVLSAAVEYISMRIHKNVLGYRLPSALANFDADRIEATAVSAVWLVTRWLDSDIAGPNAPDAFAERLSRLMADLIDLQDAPGA